MYDHKGRAFFSLRLETSGTGKQNWNWKTRMLYAARIPFDRVNIRSQYAIIHPNQTADMKERFIGTNIRSIQDVITDNGEF